MAAVDRSSPRILRMVARKATVIRVNNAVTFVIRPNMAVKLHGVKAPTPGTPEDTRAKEHLESLILKKKVEFETLEWDRLGRSIATVKAGDIDVNESMKKFLDG
jgi:endonuclease YncB( thermonuclease family)